MTWPSALVASLFSSEILGSSHAKLRRAKKHFADLQQVIDGFAAKNPYRVAIDDNAGTGDKILYLRLVEPFPAEEVSVTVGDCLNNLKAALDHATFTAARAVGMKVSPKRIKFPTGDTAQSFLSQCNGLFGSGCVDYDHWLLVRMRSFEAYPGGAGELIYVLTDLNNTDKHRALIPHVRALKHPTVQIMDGGRPILYSSGNISIGYDKFPLAFVPRGAHVKVSDDEQIPVKVFFNGILKMDMISLLKAMAADVLLHIHVLETFLEAAPHLASQPVTP